jgi:hypothetical protein
VIETFRFVLEALFFPIAIGVVLWAVTQRKTDKAAITKVLAEAAKSEVETDKAEAEVKVAEETVEAAIQLADIGTLQAAIRTMSEAFREERESLTRSLTGTATRLEEVYDELEDLRADQHRLHREMLDMYRRDQYYARALVVLNQWIARNLPRLRQLYPAMDPPPEMEPLAPLLVPNVGDDIPNRRWYDRGGQQ